MNTPTPFLILEPHQLVTPFAGLRVQHAANLDRLTHAMAEAGQIVPVLVIPDEQSQSWVLIDGYRRLEVLRRLEIEQIKAQALPCKEDEAMLLHMAHGQARSWETIEEAGLIRELHDCFGLSLRQIATRIGRHASWVQRRLALI